MLGKGHWGWLVGSIGGREGSKVLFQLVEQMLQIADLGRNGLGVDRVDNVPDHVMLVISMYPQGSALGSV